RQRNVIPPRPDFGSVQSPPRTVHNHAGEDHGSLDARGQGGSLSRLLSTRDGYEQQEGGENSDGAGRKAVLARHRMRRNPGCAWGAVWPAQRRLTAGGRATSRTVGRVWRFRKRECSLSKWVLSTTTGAGSSCLALLFALLQACTGDTGAEWAGSRETLPSGAVLVSNATAGKWTSAESWRVTESLRIGAADGTTPDVFGRVSAIEVTPDGKILVMDAAANELRVFTADGDH